MEPGGWEVDANSGFVKNQASRSLLQVVTRWESVCCGFERAQAYVDCFYLPSNSAHLYLQHLSEFVGESKWTACKAREGNGGIGNGNAHHIE